MNRIYRSILAYFALGVVGTALPSAQAQNALAVEGDGGVMNIGALTGFLSALQSNAAPQTGYMNYKSIATSATVTLNQATLPGGIAGSTLLMTGSTATALTFDSTQNIVAAIPGAFVGQTSMMMIANASTATVTATVGDANTTLSGTTTTVTLALRPYQIKVTNLPAPGLVQGVAAANTPGAAATNTTTTTAAVAGQTASLTTVSTVIPVASATGIIANASWLQVTLANGTVMNGLVTNISTLNITIAAVSPTGVTSGAAVSVWNPQVTITGMFSITGAALIA